MESIFIHPLKFKHMKTIFTLLASLLVSISLLAGGSKPKSTLTIQSYDRSNIKVVIDGRRFESHNNYMRIQSMEAGSHDLKIYREKNNGLFNIFGTRYEMVFKNYIVIKPFSDVIISIDRFGRATINESRTRGRNDWGDRKGYGDRDERKGYDDRDKNRDDDFEFDRGNQYGDYDQGRDDRFGDKNSRGYNNSGYSQAINDIEFNRVLDCIQKEWFEPNKMKSASQIIRTSFFTSAQVKQMLQLFSFENNKLELAKQAYTQTVDKQNYKCVSDVFWFNSSKDELARYIRDCR
jgi:hypothetical protein